MDRLHVSAIGGSMTARKLGFKKLEKKIDTEYQKKGYSKKKADYIAKATAGKIARKKGK